MSIKVVFQKEEVDAAAEMVMKFNPFRPKSHTVESVKEVIDGLIKQFATDTELTSNGTLGVLINLEDEYHVQGVLTRSVNVYYSAGTYAKSQGVDSYSLMYHY